MVAQPMQSTSIQQLVLEWRPWCQWTTDAWGHELQHGRWQRCSCISSSECKTMSECGGGVAAAAPQYLSAAVLAAALGAPPQC